ncbi:hypothetical protein [Riemerella columbina]|uniref:hypothetical protein n=1 Tax=Riemerella columbina TaxID=103810 RepID=UPI0003755DBD|nr:hypothetical protein [Riemerella columbina]
MTAICRRLKALGNHLIFALGSKQKATSHSKLKIYHSLLALGFKPNAGTHLSLNPFHFYLAESLKLEAYCLYAALSLAFLAMGCSPVLIFFKLCVIYLGAGRFLCALSRKPKAVGKRLRALCNNSLLATGNLKQLVQFLVAGFNPVATRQINY